MRYGLLAIVSLFFLTNCGVSPNKLKSASDYRLCYGSAAMPSYNINYKNVKAEISRRGLNCSKYSDRIDEQLDKERIARASRPVIKSTSSSRTKSSSDDDTYEPFYKQMYINGEYVNCLKVGYTWNCD